MNDDIKPYTLDELALKAADYAAARTKLREWTDKKESAKKAMESHQVKVDEAQQEVDRTRLAVRKILNNLEK